jgi:ribonuclease BN (tRNA processing enzyme)
MRITVLGSGDAFGSGGRFNACFLVETADRAVLLDCGASSLVAMRARSVDPNRIDAVILSHLHGDHFGALPFFLLDAQLLARRERALTIAGPPGTRKRLDAACEVFFPGSTGMTWRFPFEVIEIVPGSPTHVVGLGVETIEVIHPSGAPSTAIRLSDGRRVLGYSGDTEWTDALIATADGADLLIVECYEHARKVTGHLSWTTLQPRLPQLRAKQIMVTHMSPAMLAHADDARAAGLLIASDGAVVDL